MAAVDLSTVCFTGIVERATSNRGRAHRVFDSSFADMFKIYEIDEQHSMFVGRIDSTETFNGVLDDLHHRLVDAYAGPVQLTWDGMVYVVGSADNVIKVIDFEEPEDVEWEADEAAGDCAGNGVDRDHADGRAAGQEGHDEEDAA